MPFHKKQGANTYTREYTYDNRGQITNIAENNGNRIKEQEKKGTNIVAEIANTYDKANRLTTSVNTANWDYKNVVPTPIH